MPVKVRALAVVVVALGVLVSCGSSGDDTRATEDAAASRAAEAEASASAAAAEEAEEQAEREAADLAEQQAIYDECKRLTAPLAKSLREVDSRLSLGLSFNDYADRSGDAQVRYDELVRKIDQLDDECLPVARPLETALNKYTRVYNLWNSCVDDYYCDFDDDVNAKAQSNWSSASRLLDQSDRKLADLEPAGTSAPTPSAPPEDDDGDATAGTVFDSVVQLKDAAVAAGYFCKRWRQDDVVELAKESGHCSGADVLAIYASAEDRDEQLRVQQEFSDSIGIPMATILVGPNWTFNSDQAGTLADALGGTLYEEP